MARASDFVLDSELDRSVPNIGDMQESVLMLIAFLGDQTMLPQSVVRPGEIGDVELDVMPVIGRGHRAGFAKA
jgi:hypothetical protein